MKELVSHFFKSFLISPSFFPFLFLIFLTFSFIFLNLILILFCILSNVPTVLLDIFVSDCKSECSMQIAFLTTFQYHFPLFAFPFFFFYLLLSLPLIFSRVSFFFYHFYLSFPPFFFFLFSFFLSHPVCTYSPCHLVNPLSRIKVLNLRKANLIILILQTEILE